MGPRKTFVVAAIRIGDVWKWRCLEMTRFGMTGDSGKVHVMDWHGNAQEPDKRMNVKRILSYIIYMSPINIGLPTKITIWPISTYNGTKLQCV